MTHSPIVITGVGILSSLGVGAPATLAALREGARALFPARRYAPPEGVTPLAGQVPEFNIADFLDTPKAFLDRNSELFLAACGMALRDAAIAPKTLPEGRAGILAGSAWGGLDSMTAFFADCVAKGPRLVKPLLFPHTYANTAISLAAMEWSLTGPHLHFSGGRVAAAQAIAEAFRLLREGAADMLPAGGCEALGRPLHQAMASLDMLAPPDDDQAPHPFASGRRGTVPGEAGAVLILETEAHAAGRGALPLARVTGAGIGAPAAAIKAALSEAAVDDPRELAGICVSANGCAAVDGHEARGLNQALAGASVPLFAPAALCGDTQGACGALQAALGVLMLKHKTAPPATLLKNPTALGLSATTMPIQPWRAGRQIAILTTDPSGSAAALVLENV